MPLFDDYEPALQRGVIRMSGNCAHCGRKVPVLGKPGHGRPLDTFAPDSLCEGHAIFVES